MTCLPVSFCEWQESVFAKAKSWESSWIYPLLCSFTQSSHYGFFTALYWLWSQYTLFPSCVLWFSICCNCQIFSVSHHELSNHSLLPSFVFSNLSSHSRGEQWPVGKNKTDYLLFPLCLNLLVMMAAPWKAKEILCTSSVFLLVWLS